MQVCAALVPRLSQCGQQHALHLTFTCCAATVPLLASGRAHFRSSPDAAVPAPLPRTPCRPSCCPLLPTPACLTHRSVSSHRWVEVVAQL